MFVRPGRTALYVVVILLAVPFTSFAQNNPPHSKRGYKRPTINRGSPARPLTGPKFGHPSDVAKEYIRENASEIELSPDDTAERPNGAIYAFWDDNFIDELSFIMTELKGTAPNRRFVIEFRNARFFNDTTRRIDFNIVLFEDGRLMTQYRNLANDGRERGDSATIGIENPEGDIALEFSMNEAILAAEPAVNTIMYRPPGIP